MNLADEDKIFNLKESSKSAFTFNMDSERFACKLSTTAGKQSVGKRLYLQSLPYYIEDRERRQNVTEDQNGQSKMPVRKLDYA